MKNNMVRAISENGGIVICAIDSTEIVRDMERIHKTSAVVSAALGRMLTAASLMGSWMKNPQDNLTLRMAGGGPAGVILAISDGDSNVRGYATYSGIELPLKANGKLDVGAAVGTNGTLSVMKDLGMKEPYIGQVPIVSGEIAEDVTAYYAASEQTPTVCSLGVLVNTDLSIQCAGGYLLQLLPGATEAEIAQIEANIKDLPQVTQLLSQGGSPYDMINTALKGFAPQILEEKTAEYMCKCSREKTEDILVGIGKEELLEMQKEDNNAKVECHFCNKTYLFNLEELIDDNFVEIP